jgi:hypothetical protein
MRVAAQASPSSGRYPFSIFRYPFLLINQRFPKELLNQRFTPAPTSRLLHEKMAQKPTSTTGCQYTIPLNRGEALDILSVFYYFLLYYGDALVYGRPHPTSSQLENPS